MQNLSEAIHKSGMFDAIWYSNRYPDVRMSGMDPLDHYLKIGSRLKRDPSPHFSFSFYLKENPDVASSGMDPLLHYIQYGRLEGRACKAPPPPPSPRTPDNSTYAPDLGTHIDNIRKYISNKKKDNKIAVYTALIGEYDTLKTPLSLDPEIDYICFTDRYFPGLHAWQFRKPAFMHTDATRISRYHKMHPHILLQEYDTVVWIDATLLVRETGNLKELVSRHVQSKKAISTCRHPYRGDVYSECAACVQHSKDDAEVMHQQMQRYRDAGVSASDSLAETMVVISRPKEAQVASFFELWWKEICSGSRRDQLSLPYVCYQLKLPFNSLFEEGYDYRHDGKFFRYFEHGTADQKTRYGKYVPPKMPMEPSNSLPSRDNIGTHKPTVALVLASMTDGRDYTGTSYIRLLLPFAEARKQLGALSYTIVTDDMLRLGCDTWASNVDAIYTLRSAPSHDGLKALLRLAGEKNLPIAYDLDDNILVDAPNFSTNADTIKTVKKLLQKAALVSVSMEPLAQLCRPLTNGRVVVRDNALSPIVWPSLKPNAAHKITGKPVKVLYMGTRSHDGDLEIVEPAARRILETYPDVEFHVIGGLQKPSSWLKPVNCRGDNYSQFVPNFTKKAQEYDFAICPLADSEFNTYKSFIKFLDYSAAGLPAIYSEHPIYRELVRDRVNGIIANNNAESWYNSLKYMIDNPQERARIAANAHSEVSLNRMINYSYCEKLALDLFPNISVNKPGAPVGVPSNPAQASQHSLCTSIAPLQGTSAVLNYRSYSDLAHDIRKNIARIPRDIDMVVGIPRSGMIPAYIIGSLLNRPVISLDELVHGLAPSKGDRKLSDQTSGARRILVVDDSLNLGNALSRLNSSVPETYLGEPFSWEFLAIYASEKGTTLGANYLMELKTPRIFQWNYRNHGIAARACYDIDGVLCIDPTDEQNDDGPIYREFLLNAAPLYIPKHPIMALVTSRLEKYRSETEEWMRRHGVIYKKLFMLDLPSKEERIRLRAHGSFKAQVYETLADSELFIESNPKQAKEISERTRKPVICTETDEFYPQY